METKSRRATLDKTIEDLRSSWLHVYELLWRLAELHFHRVVLLLIVFMATYQYSVLNLVYFFMVIATLLLPRFRRLCFFIIGVYVLLMFASQILSDTMNGKFVGGGCIGDEYEVNKNQTTWQWVGFKGDKNAGEYAFKVVTILFIVALFLIHHRQQARRRRFNEPPPTEGILFEDAVDIQLLDKNLLFAFKVSMNYVFYKFGLEFSMIFMFVDAFIRMNIISDFLILFIIVLVFVPRRWARVLWPLIVIALSIIWPAQYAMELGWMCKDGLYPWSNMITSNNENTSRIMNQNLADFLGLADYRNKPRSCDRRLIVDFLLLMIVIAQWFVFRVESKRHPAGSNSSIYSNGRYILHKDNPRYDFIAEKRSSVDYLKTFVFMHGHWATLFVILSAGLLGGTLFPLGYLILGFWMLWEGTDLYTMKNYRRTLIKWLIICAYNLVVMFLKISLQIVGCVFILPVINDCIKDAKAGAICVTRGLFNITCNDEVSHRRFDNNHQYFDSVIWLDVVAFIFIIFQLRIFHSYYFQRCIVEIKCEMVQSNRGAVLINQLVEKEMKEQHQQQKAQLKSIKERMAMIRERYLEQQKRSETVYNAPKTYAEARLAGDYYMFDYDPNAAEPNIVEPHVVEPNSTNTQQPSDDVESAEVTRHQISAQNSQTPVVNFEQEIQLPREEGYGSISGSEESKGKAEMVFNSIQHVWRMFITFLNNLADFFNRHSREQRYASYVLGKEKVRLKASMEENLYAPSQSYRTLRSEWKAQGLNLVSSTTDIVRLEEEIQGQWQQRSTFIKFMIAFVCLLRSYTHVLCYILAVITQAINGGLITLPLPLMVFFWATLSSPRPPRLFWVIMITYTEIIILIQFIYKFKVIELPDNGANGGPFDWTYLVGIQKQYYFVNICLLISLFIHRSILRKFGLWKGANVAESFADNSVSSTASNMAPDAHSMNESASSSFCIQQIETDGNEPKRTRFKRFYHNLMNPRICYIRDLYPFMFFCDLICMFILIVFYSHFGEASSSSVSVITSTRIPLMLVVMIFILLLMMIVDRAIYLVKSVKWKLYYQLFTIVLLHAWILGILPKITQMKASDNTFAGIFYVLKCLHLIISAWQIRNGYPKLCVGNLITRFYALPAYIIFNVYMFFPLAFEIRTIVDWTWTETTMPLFDFIKFETFYAKIYMTKCSRVLDQWLPAPRGVPKPALAKYLLGISITIGVIILVLSPLLVFALLNRIGTQTNTERVDLSVSLEGYPPLYTMTAQGGSEVRRGSREEWRLLREKFEHSNSDLNRRRLAVSYINDYFPIGDSTDFFRIRFRPESAVYWPISNESLTSMTNKLNNITTGDGKDILRFHLNVKFIRDMSNDRKDPLAYAIDKAVDVNAPIARSLLDAIDNSSAEVNIPSILPYFLHVPMEGQIDDSTALLKVVDSQRTSNFKEAYSNITLSKPVISENKIWWTIQFKPNGNLTMYTFDFENVDYGTRRDLRYIPMVFFVDRMFPWYLMYIAKGSTLAMYLAVVFVVAQVLRNVVLSSPLDVIITELPNPDHILQICLDIYLVREARDFVLEEDLFAKLIFLFRSTATMIKWSRRKRE